MIASLALIEGGGKDNAGKLELATVVSDLMPSGKPNFLEVIKYPKIADLVKTEGKGYMMKLIFILVKDFCASVNVVRNMNEDQMIEAASMLIDDCENFRMEDYTMMFALAKRGRLVEFRDRIDLTVISKIMDEYWLVRRKAAKEKEEADAAEMASLGSTKRETEGDQPISSALDKLTGAFGHLKAEYKKWQEDNNLRDQISDDKK